MAAKSKSATSAKDKAAGNRPTTLLHKRAGSRKSKQRGPTADRRTTLRVPRTLEAEVTRTAGELGVSGNEALIRLAQLGAEAAKRQRSIRKVVGKRRAAVLKEKRVGTLPSPDEMQEAILVDRR